MTAGSPSDIFRSLRTDDCATFLSVADCQFDIVGELGRSLLHEAIAHGKIDAAHSLIAGHAGVDARDDLGLTPLHYAATFNQIDIVTRLIDAGADANAVDRYGNNPLWTAILNPSIDRALIQLLVRSGSSKISTNNAGNSAAKMAEIIGDEEILKICTTHDR